MPLDTDGKCLRAVNAKAFNGAVIGHGLNCQAMSQSVDTLTMERVDDDSG